ncbi:MAG: hypothetical protein J7578_12155 [Chitinophagaceae bacterium]|nr:hypothetical protein [Chitinophagaceae bacterium]
MRVEKPSGKKLFEEEQPMRRSWVMLLLATVLAAAIAVNVFALGGMIRQRTPSPIWALWVGVITPLIPLIVLYFARLESIITDDGIYFRWRPWRRTFKKIPFEGMSKVTVVERAPLKLGGSYALGYGWIHQVSGRRGVELENGGERLWLGTQRLQAFLYAVEQAGGGKVQIVQKKQKTSL